MILGHLRTYRVTQARSGVFIGHDANHKVNRYGRNPNLPGLSRSNLGRRGVRDGINSANKLGLLPVFYIPQKEVIRVKTEDIVRVANPATSFSNEKHSTLRRAVSQQNPGRHSKRRLHHALLDDRRMWDIVLHR